MHWGKFRKKSADRVVEELLTLYKIHGRQLFLMSDSLLNPMIMELSEKLIEHEVSIYWDGYLRAETPFCGGGEDFTALASGLKAVPRTSLT